MSKSNSIVTYFPSKVIASSAPFVYWSAIGLPFSWPPEIVLRSSSAPLAARVGIQVMSRVATSGASPDETPTVNFSFMESQSSAW